MESLNEFRNKGMPVNSLINIRHMLTANIEKNLYNNLTKEEGRRALQVRNVLDETVFKLKPEDLQDGDPEAITFFRRGIKFENLSEQLGILENA